AWTLNGVQVGVGASLVVSPQVSTTYTVRATNAGGTSTPATITVQVSAAPPPTLSTAALPSGTVGVAYSATATASGGSPPYTFSIVAGTLPAGLTLSTSGVLSGTPATAGSYSFTMRVTDAVGGADSRAYAIAITAVTVPQPTLSPATLPSGTVSAPYSVTATAAGGTPPYAFSIVTGTLPAGLALATSGTLSGTPTIAGNSSFTMKVTDAAGGSDSRAYSIAIAAGAPGTPTNCVATINGVNSVLLPSSGGLVLLAVNGCATTSGLTYTWSRNGVSGVSTAAAWTDTLGANNSSIYQLSSYQVTICGGDECVTAPPAAPKGTALPLTALVDHVQIPDDVRISVLEFYNAGLDHYFISPITDEIVKLMTGTVIKGWQLTGATFTAHKLAQSGSSPVCRYYIPPNLGDSHFFGRGTAECNATGQKNPSFALEDPAFMQMFLPTAGNCPANTTQVYRVYSNRADANHRYITDKAIRSEMVAKGWAAEGDGANMVVMCAPTGIAPPPASPACTVTASSGSPQIGQTVTFTADCSNNPTSYTWTNCSSSSATCNVASSTAGVKIITLVATNAAGSSSPVSIAIDWQGSAPPPAPFCTLSATDSSAQVGQSITITANCTNSPTSYSWTNCTPSGTSCSDANTTPGIKTYTLVAANAAGSSAPATIQVGWQPGRPVCTPTQTPANPVAPPGTQVTLTANCTNNPTSYSWTAAGVPIVGGATAVVSPLAPTTYAVVAVNGGGTSAATTITVVVVTEGTNP
ncbi:MAG: Ig domain-containing protein, partial [Betaproteobacteria bacterium]